MELDEMSKEDFYRLKKVLNNKRQITDEMAQKGGAQNSAQQNIRDMESDNILNEVEKKDEDVFF